MEHLLYWCWNKCSNVSYFLKQSWHLNGRFFGFKFLFGRFGIKIRPNLLEQNSSWFSTFENYSTFWTSLFMFIYMTCKSIFRFKHFFTYSTFVHVKMPLFGGNFHFLFYRNIFNFVIFHFQFDFYIVSKPKNQKIFFTTH